MPEELSSIVEFSVNLKDQKEPEPLPLANYVGVINNTEVRMSQRETKYAAVAFHISVDQYPADYKDGNPDGTTIIYRRVSLEDNPGARYGARRFCEAIGAPLGKKIDISEWVGLEATVEVTHNTYEGRTSPNINKVQSV